jgi:WG containing repeat
MRRLWAVLCSVQLAYACETAPPLWSIQSPDADPFYRIVQKGKVGYINNQGRIVVAPKLDESVDGEFHNGLLVTGVSDGPYIDATGKKILDTGFFRNWDFSEGLAVAMREDTDKKWGYIDTRGNFAIPQQFDTSLEDYVEPFSGGFARIKVKGLYGFIDHTGKFAIPPTLLHAGEFSDGMVRVVLEGPCFVPGSGLCDLDEIVPPNSGKKGERPPSCKFTFVDKNGRAISTARFDGAGAFSEGLAPVKIDSLWAYINRDGAIAISPQFDDAVSFSDGVAAVRQSGLYGYIDKSGVLVIPAQFKQASDFHEGLAYVGDRESGYSYIDHHGKQAFRGSFVQATNFYHGLAQVQLKGNFSFERFAYIDTVGHTRFTYTVP